jgi:phosphoribosylanthranilate isomerase
LLYKIKVNSITNLTDARYFAAKEVTYLGFNLEVGTENYLDPIYMKAIKEWVEGPKIVGEFRNSSPETVLEAAQFYGLDAVQVPFSWTYEQLEILENLDVLLEITPLEILRLDLSNINSFHHYRGDYTIIADFSQDNQSWNNLKKQLELLKLVKKIPNLLIDLDFSAQDLPEILEIVQPLGFCLIGGDEERVGVKSFDDIDAIFDVLEFISRKSCPNHGRFTWHWRIFGAQMCRTRRVCGLHLHLR